MINYSCARDCPCVGVAAPVRLGSRAVEAEIHAEDAAGYHLRPELPGARLGQSERPIKRREPRDAPLERSRRT